MARGSHWWSEPPWWAWVVIVVGAVWLIAGGVFALNRTPPRATAADAGVPLVQDTAEPAPEDVPRILVIGDSYTGGSDEGGVGNASWPRLLASDLIAEGRQVRLDISAAGGSGYATAGPSGETFVQLAQQAGTDYNLVVFFGSRNDTASQEAVQQSADQAYSAIKASSPQATLLVIGPPWVDADPPSNVQRSRDAVAASAQAAGATFVDPLAEGWFTDDPSLIGSDGVHPTDEGHRYMADTIRPHIEQLLPAPTG